MYGTIQAGALNHWTKVTINVHLMKGKELFHCRSPFPAEGDFFSWGFSHYQEKMHLWMHNNDFDILLRSVQYLAFLCFFLFVVWPNSGHFWGVYQSHCASEGAFLFSFIYVMYLNIASYFYGKQIRSKLGNMLYLWMIFICVQLVCIRVIPWSSIEKSRYRSDRSNTV